MREYLDCFDDFFCLNSNVYFELFQSSISGTGADAATSPATIVRQQSNPRNVHSRHLNEYLTVFV